MGEEKDITVAQLGQSYLISNVANCDEETKDFLFSLGCYEGEPITVVNKLSNTYAVVVKDARYSFDADVAVCVKLSDSVPYPA